MLGIFHAPLVNIVAYHVFSAQFGAGESKDSRTRSAIQDALGSDRHVEQLGNNHACGFVVSCSERQFRLNTYFDNVGSVARIGIEFGMFRVVNHHLIVHINWFESLFFPFLVPILIFCIFHLVGYFRIPDREIGNICIQHLLVEEFFLHISFQSGFCFFKRFESGFGCSICKQILRGLHQVGSRFNSECCY